MFLDEGAAGGQAFGLVALALEPAVEPAGDLAVEVRGADAGDMGVSVLPRAGGSSIRVSVGDGCVIRKEFSRDHPTLRIRFGRRIVAHRCAAGQAVFTIPSGDTDGDDDG